MNAAVRLTPNYKTRTPDNSKKMKTRIATAIVASMLLLPAALALWLYPFGLAATGDWLLAAGRFAGILGLTALLVDACLSTRLPGFDTWFGGLTKLWRAHHYIGAASFVLLMLHPLLLAWAALPVSTGAAVGLLFPDLAQLWTWIGWLALICMMVFLAPSFAFFSPPRYQRWKGLHLISGAALVLGLMHAVPLSRALPAAWGWRIWSVLGLAAVGAFAYRALFSRRFARLRYRVSQVMQLADGVVEITLQPQGRSLAYRAGQFVYFAHLDRTLGAGYNEQHPFTLSSAPQEAGLRIGIKNLGDMSSALQRINPGADVSVEGPYGDFFPPGLDRRPQLWLGGGIGITPFVGRARALAHENDQAAPADLVYCAENPARSYYLDELREIAARLPNFKVHSHLFEREGVLSAAYLDAACPDWREREVFLCGPLGMLKHCRGLLRAAGIRRLHIEEFDLL